jgi:hypothetical protein
MDTFGGEIMQIIVLIMLKMPTRKMDFPQILQMPKITVNNHVIEIIEEKTGFTAPLTTDKWENTPPGENIQLQIKVNTFMPISIP